jgi:hypothetical protein
MLKSVSHNNFSQLAAAPIEPLFLAWPSSGCFVRGATSGPA